MRPGSSEVYTPVSVNRRNITRRCDQKGSYRQIFIIFFTPTEFLFYYRQNYRLPTNFWLLRAEIWPLPANFLSPPVHWDRGVCWLVKISLLWTFSKKTLDFTIKMWRVRRLMRAKIIDTKSARYLIRVNISSFRAQKFILSRRYGPGSGKVMHFAKPPVAQHGRSSIFGGRPAEGQNYGWGVCVKRRSWLISQESLELPVSVTKSTLFSPYWLGQ